MAEHVCPPWVGRLLLSPLRKLVESPKKILGPFVEEGMVVLEPGCAMGFFTLPLARMVGPEGKVIAVDVQAKMLTTLQRRAQKKGLIDRVELRTADSNGLGVADLRASVDFCPAIHVVHEVPDQARFFGDVADALKAGATLLVIEPRGHVSEEHFQESISAAENVGFRRIESPHVRGGRKALLERVGE